MFSAAQPRADATARWAACAAARCSSYPASGQAPEQGVGGLPAGRPIAVLITLGMKMPVQQPCQSCTRKACTSSGAPLLLTCCVISCRIPVEHIAHAWGFRGHECHRFQFECCISSLSVFFRHKVLAHSPGELTLDPTSNAVTLRPVLLRQDFVQWTAFSPRKHLFSDACRTSLHGRGCCLRHRAGYRHRESPARDRGGKRRTAARHRRPTAAPSISWREERIGRGDTLQSLLARLGVEGAEAHQILCGRTKQPGIGTPDPRPQRACPCHFRRPTAVVALPCFRGDADHRYPQRRRIPGQRTAGGAGGPPDHALR